MRKMYIGIYGWARVGFRDCQLLANIVGETRPYQIRRRGRVLEIVNYWQILSVKPAPTKSAKCTSGFMVGRGRVLEIVNY